MTGTMDEVKDQVQETMSLKNIEIPHRHCLEAPRTCACAAHKCESWVKNYRTVGWKKISKILWMIGFWGQMSQVSHFDSVDEKKQKKGGATRKERRCIKQTRKLKGTITRKTFDETEVISNTGALNTTKGGNGCEKLDQHSDSNREVSLRCNFRMF